MQTPDFRQQICGVIRGTEIGLAASAIVWADMDDDCAMLTARGWIDKVAGPGVSGPRVAMFVRGGQLWVSLYHDDAGELTDFWYDWDARRWTPGVMPEN